MKLRAYQTIVIVETILLIYSYIFAPVVNQLNYLTGQVAQHTQRLDKTDGVLETLKAGKP